MFKMTDATIPTLHIISEPGDATRYDYYVHKHWDDYYFFSVENTFNYPRRICEFDVPDYDLHNSVVRAADLDGEYPEIMGMAEEADCNPWTMIECLRTLQFIMSKGEEIL